MLLHPVVSGVVMVMWGKLGNWHIFMPVKQKMLFVRDVLSTNLVHLAGAF